MSKKIRLVSTKNCKVINPIELTMEDGIYVNVKKISEYIKVNAKYEPTDKWFAPPDCAKIASVSIDGKKVKFRMIKAFEIMEYIDKAKEISIMYKQKK